MHRIDLRGLDPRRRELRRRELQRWNPRRWSLALGAALALLVACNDASEPAADVEDVGVDAVDVIDVEPEPEPLPTGAACASREACQGSACLDFPGGYCSVSPCRGGVTRCPGDGVCDIAVERRECLDACESDLDCRAGYGCVDLESERRVCLPVALLEPSQAGGPAGDMDCYPVPYGGNFQVPVATDPDVISQTVVAYTERGRVRPVRVSYVDGTSERLDDGGDLASEVGYRVERTLAQVTVPATPHSPTLPETAAVTIRAEDTDEVCVRVYTRTEPGNVLRINAYVNSLQDFDAETAAGSRTMEGIFSVLAGILGDAGLDVEVRYRDLDPRVAEANSLVRDERSADALVRAAALPPAVEPLSLNVFFVESLVVRNSTLLGISRGIPGAPGMHGTSGGGVIVVGEGIAAEQADEALIGQVIGHEIGHYLGLYHTTERSGLRFDPLRDTPECPRDSAEFAFQACRDQTNLMWPTAWRGENIDLTRQQEWVIRRHPLAVE